VVALFSARGIFTAFQVEASAYGAFQLGAHDDDVVANALYHRFVEFGGNYPVSYSYSVEAAKEEEVP
jgi:hypothetical protein